MLYRKKHKMIVLKILISILILSIFWGASLKRFVIPYFSNIEAQANCIVNNALTEILNNISIDAKYNELINVNYKENGTIASLTSDCMSINLLKTKVTGQIQDYIYANKKKTVKIPAGSISGNPILSAYGPKLLFKINPVTLTKIKLRDEFTSCGINQVRHTIYLDVMIDFKISTVSFKKIIPANDSLIVTDTVIVGDVPDLYTGSGIVSSE